MTENLDATAGFHFANSGIHRTVVLADEICIQEKERIRLSYEPEMSLLQSSLCSLSNEELALRSMLASTSQTMTQETSWPLWHTVMAVVFILAGFGFARLSFEPFDLDLLWAFLVSVGVAVLCAYGTDQFLEKTNHRRVVLCLSVALFAVGLAGLSVLASVRGDLFALHLQSPSTFGDSGPGAANENARAFYRSAAPKMQLFLSLLSVALELAGGLAIHEVRTALKVRVPRSPSDNRRLEAVGQERGQAEAQLAFLRNQPAIFEAKYRRNFAIGLLKGAVQHARSCRGVPTAFAFLMCLIFSVIAYGQTIDVIEALDFSATSKAEGFDGSAAHTLNIRAAAKLVRSLPPGSHVTVSGISDESFARPMVLLTGDIPAAPGRLHEFNQIVATRNRLAEDFLRVVPAVKPNYPHTDILGFLLNAGMTFRSSPQWRHALVIFSDMRQASAPLDIEQVRVVPVTAALATIDRNHLFAEDLAGVDVYILGVHAVGKDVAYWQSLRDFWTQYFARCHANLRVFSLNREIPDLNLSR